MNISQVLDLIERWQQEVYGSEQALAIAKLRALPIPALRALAEQHAAQLRDAVGERDVLEAAADFLAAPQREPEVADAKASE